MTTTRRLSGPKKLYRHVGSTPVTLKLTPEGVAIMVATQERTKLSRGDVFEYLLRTYGREIPDDLLEQAKAAEAEADAAQAETETAEAAPEMPGEAPPLTEATTKD